MFPITDSLCILINRKVRKAMLEEEENGALGADKSNLPAHRSATPFDPIPNQMIQVVTATTCYEYMPHMHCALRSPLKRK